MHTLKEICDALLRVLFGHNAVDNVGEWKDARDKAKLSRAEVEQIIKESEKSQ